MTYYTLINSPLGSIRLTSDGESLTGLHLSAADEQSGQEEHAPVDGIRDDHAAPFPDAVEQIEAYFAGVRMEFQIPMTLHGTEFQKRVWAALQEIPYGARISYGELARRLGAAGAARAVGLANGRNPIALIVPCHRVIGSDGKLVGYGGGLWRKEALLAFESSIAAGGGGRFPVLNEGD